MHRVVSKFDFKLLSAKPKTRSHDVEKDMLTSINIGPEFLNTVITGVESLVYGYDAQIEAQS